MKERRGGKHLNVEDVKVVLPASPLHRSRAATALQAVDSAAKAVAVLRRANMEQARRAGVGRKVEFTFPLELRRRKARDVRVASSSELWTKMKTSGSYFPASLDDVSAQRASHTEKLKAGVRTKPLGQLSDYDVIGNFINNNALPSSILPRSKPSVDTDDSKTSNANNCAKQTKPKKKRKSDRKKLPTAADDPLPVTLNLLFNMAPRVAMGIIERLNGLPGPTARHASDGPLSSRGGPYDGTAYGRFLRLMRSRDFRGLLQ